VNVSETLTNTAIECREVWEDDQLIARIVPHDSGVGWQIVDLAGNTLDPRSYATQEWAEKSVPRRASELAEFIVVHGEFHQPVIINTGAIAIARTKTASNGSKHIEILITSGITVTTDMTIEDLTKRLGALPA
jgi:hypothetical protein